MDGDKEGADDNKSNGSTIIFVTGRSLSSKTTPTRMPAITPPPTSSPPSVRKSNASFRLFTSPGDMETVAHQVVGAIRRGLMRRHNRLVHSLVLLLVLLQQDSPAATTTNIWTLWGGYRMGTRHKGKHYLWPPLANTVVWTILILDAGQTILKYWMRVV